MRTALSRPRRIALICLIAVVLVPLLAVARCSLLTTRLPAERSRAERHADFPTGPLPVQQSVHVYWNDAQVPFIDARDDHDLFFALGLVHAHLRLGQMETLRRIAKGRISEMAGPLTTDIDHALRIIGFARAGARSVDALRPDTRRFVEEYVRGINFYAANLKKEGRLPYEFAALNFEWEPWSVADVMTLGRLAATDVNWLLWLRLLSFSDHPKYDELRGRYMRIGSGSLPSFAAGALKRSPANRGAQRELLASLLAGHSRSGSNSFVLARDRFRAPDGTPAAAVVSDPHLGILIPNVWIIAGYRSPSFHAVGLMIPGLPILGLGRNRDIAWGGTNMRSRSSDLYDVTNIPESELTIQTERIRVRSFFDEERRVRMSPHGPVLSDAALIEGAGERRIALRWVGHDASDEISAFLDMQRASDFQEFRRAFQSYAVSGQNFLYADRRGNIGQIAAYRQPLRRASEHDPLVLDPDNPAHRWSGFRDPTQLPYAYNPAEGFLASANNKPMHVDPPISPFFGSNDRIRRLKQLLARDRGVLDREALNAVQQDVYSISGVEVRDALLAALNAKKTAHAKVNNQAGEVYRAFADWDGNYDRDSTGALAFQLIIKYLAEEVYGDIYGEEFPSALLSSELTLRFLKDDLSGPYRPRILAALPAAFRRARAPFEEFGAWGEMHRLRLAHPLGNIPWLGARYRLYEAPADGSATTLWKTAHNITDEKHYTSYGANARHISLMHDDDANYFVLLGGQDGRFSTPNLIDQTELWMRGEFIRVPLRLETVRREFTYVSKLSPNASGGEP